MLSFVLDRTFMYRMLYHKFVILKYINLIMKTATRILFIST